MTLIRTSTIVSKQGEECIRSRGQWAIAKRCNKIRPEWTKGSL